MIDTTTHEPIVVSTDGDAGPYIMVPVHQLDELTRLLRTHHISHWVDEDAISLNGQPEVAVINLGRGADPRLVQGLLDAND